MSLFTDLTERVRALIFRRREEAEMAEEMRFHLEMSGRKAFGAIENYKEEVRDARGTRLLEDSIADVGWSLRTLARSKRFTIVAILTLALGTGGVTAVFSAVNAVLLKPLPYGKPEQLVRVYTSFVNDRDARGFVSVPYFNAYRTQLSTFAQAAATFTYDVRGADIDLGGGAERIKILPVTADYFATLRAPPAIGRAFESREEIGSPVVILSHEFWLRRFGGDPSALGRSITMSGIPRTIVGVGPEEFRDPVSGAVDAWIPVDIAAHPGDFTPGNNFLTVLARLKPGASITQAQAELDALCLALAIANPQEKNYRGVLVPLKTDVVGTADRALVALLGAVGLVLLLVCVNIANLLLVRASERSREFAVRSALGARRTRLVRQLLIESLTLAVAGGVAGIGVARLAMAALARLGAGSIPRIDQVALDPWILMFSLGVSTLSALGFGLVPALRAARVDPNGTLREQARGASSSAGQGRLRAGLVIAQVALAFVLLVGAGVLLASLARLEQTPLGVGTDHVLTFRVSLPDATYDSTARARFYETLAERIAQVPGVRAVGGISKLPATGEFNQWGTDALSGPLAGTKEENALTDNRVVSGQYFAAAQIPVLAGRVFDARDDAGVPRHIVISHSAAQRFFPGVDAIGQQLNAGDRESVVIGVVGDVAIFPDGRTEPYVYYAHRQFAGDRNWSLVQLVRTDGPPLNAAPAVRRALALLDPRLVMDHPAPLDEVIGQGSAQRIFTMRILVSFAAVALLLAAVGLFGVLSYIVTLRGKEIGIRMALGADRGVIRAMVLRQGLVVTALGIGLGLLGALSLSKIMASLLYDTSPLDPRVLVGAIAFMTGVAGAAAYFPARRATAIDPKLALQGE